MRTVTIDGKDFQIRPLKRKEIKKLKADGFNLAALKAEKADDAMEAVFEMVFDVDERRAIDEITQPQALRLWKSVLMETYGSGDEEKNSSRSGSGSRTDKESNIVETA